MTTPLRNQAFALAVAAVGKDGAADLLRDRAGGSLKTLTEHQWRRIIAQLREDQSRREAPGCGFTQWQRIQYLRRQLGWTDEHLRNFLKMIAKVDHERFLDAPGARAVLAGLQKIKARRAAGIVSRRQKATPETLTPNP
jgi:hypothetical protein